jgi:hypothetical protein
MAIGRILNSPSPTSVAPFFDEPMPGTTDRFEVRVHFAGFEPALAQSPGGNLVGAHFDIDSTGYSARRAVERQLANVMLVMPSSGATPLPCEPELPGRRCHVAGELERLSWQRVAVQ